MTASFSRTLRQAGLVLAFALSLSTLSTTASFAYTAEAQQMCTGGTGITRSADGGAARTPRRHRRLSLSHEMRCGMTAFRLRKPLRNESLAWISRAIPDEQISLLHSLCSDCFELTRTDRAPT